MTFVAMRHFRFAFVLVALVVSVSAVADPGHTHSVDQVRLYDTADGSAVFAASLTSPGEVEAKPRDVVIVVDTSASQAGLYRDTVMAAVQGTVASLGASDRVRLAGGDIELREYTTEFVAAGSDSLKQAVTKLQREAPLGATDLPLVVNEASKLFDENNPRQRVLLYLGDGRSAANLVPAAEMQKLVDQLKLARISLTSYAVGPACDSQFLAALANHTGGNLFVDEGVVWPNEEESITFERALAENRRRGASVGRQLAEWSTAGVQRPSDLKLPATVVAVYPTALPPLRSDRDTILLGRLEPGAKGPITFGAYIDGQRHEWTIELPKSNEAHAYLGELVEMAAADGGVTLPTLGTAGLMETARMVQAKNEQLANLAERAVATGDMQGARDIATSLLEKDPGNLRAATVRRVTDSGSKPIKAREMAHKQSAGSRVQAKFVQETVAPGDEDTIVLVPDLVEGVPTPGNVSDGTFLSEIERNNRVFSEMLEREVNVAMGEARDMMRRDPESARQLLKLQLEAVRQAPELIPEARTQLSNEITGALQEVARVEAIKDELDREIEERAAAAREQKLLNDRLMREQEREKQLMARFNALMDEGRYAEAREITDLVEEIAPETVTPRVAELWSRMERHHYLQMSTRRLRHRSSWETWYQCETSAIPLPDEPPIVYPDAEFWEDLTNRRKKYAAVDLKGQDGAEQKISEALSSPLNALGLEFTETPLEEVVAFLRDEYEIEVQLDNRALDELGIQPDEPITVNLRNVTLRSALKLMLKELDLTYVIDDEVLLITSVDEAAQRLTVKVYPVADLVLPIQTPTTGGFGGGLGGGAFGGGGLGGGGGGGFGGQGGGGFGGGGFGGQGGGGFGGGAFSVPDDLSEPVAASTEEQPATRKPLRTRSTKKESRVEIDEAVAPAVFWDQYFAAGRRNQVVVRAEVRDLMKAGRYEHVVGLVNAALRHGQPQPWMYESLGIAMRMQGAPASQVERAVMSAVDFSTSADELMFIAQYLQQLDLDLRAAKVYHQVVKIDPQRNEAYVLAMRCGELTDDVGTLMWTTAGVLSQAWPERQATIRGTALRLAQATVDRLTNEGRQAELDAYQAQLAAALERDCIVRISWTGDADLDLIVEEPTGTVCSAGEPRTTAGGVNLGDSFAVVGAEGSGVFSETYVCPQGFSGTYRAKIQPIWGDVTADKVTVELFTNHNGKHALHQRQQIELGEDGAVVNFDLEHGRRTQPLAAAQVAAAAVRQERLSRAMLAKQIGSMADPGAIPVRPGAAAEANRNRQLAQGGRGAVGFQPVIVTLPEGTNFFATGVVSADRRYVRITTVPFFSTIGDVTTFTFAGAGQQVPGDDDDDDDDGGAVAF